MVTERSPGKQTATNVTETDRGDTLMGDVTRLQRYAQLFYFKIKELDSVPASGGLNRMPRYKMTKLCSNY